MRFAFWLRESTSRKHQMLVKAVVQGAGINNVFVKVVDEPEVRDEYDGLIMFGIGGNSRVVYDAWKAAHKGIIFLDKGYTRGAHIRVAVNDFQPLKYFSKQAHPNDRWAKLGQKLLPYTLTKEQTHILFDGASNKLCMWLGLGDQHVWGQQIIDRIRKYTDMPIIYRPRPSHNKAVALPGAELSVDRPLAKDFARSLLVVSYGGNIGFDAVVQGIPHFAIGESIARPVSQIYWSQINKPFVPAKLVREQWLADVAYCQWTPDEFFSGEAWRYIKEVWAERSTASLGVFE